MNISADVLNDIVRVRGLLDRMIICDESWLFTYDIEQNVNRCTGRAQTRHGRKKQKWAIQNSKPL